MTDTNTRSVVEDALVIAQAITRAPAPFSRRDPESDPVAADREELAAALEIVRTQHVAPNAHITLADMNWIESFEPDGRDCTVWGEHLTDCTVWSEHLIDLTADELMHHAAAQVVRVATARREIDEAGTAFTALLRAAIERDPASAPFRAAFERNPASAP
jgi:hypothetical protein